MNRMQGKQPTTVWLLKAFVFAAISAAAALPTPDLVAGHQAHSYWGAALDEGGLRSQKVPALWQTTISNVDLDIQELKDLALEVQRLQDEQDDRDGHDTRDMTNVRDRDDSTIDMKSDLRPYHRLDIFLGASESPDNDILANAALSHPRSTRPRAQRLLEPWLAMALVLGAIAALAVLAYRWHLTLGSPHIGPQTLLFAVFCCPFVLMFPIDESADTTDVGKRVHLKSDP